MGWSCILRATRSLHTPQALLLPHPTPWALIVMVSTMESSTTCHSSMKSPWLNEFWSMITGAGDGSGEGEGNGAAGEADGTCR
jgi:hypothetical protein